MRTNIPKRYSLYCMFLQIQKSFTKSLKNIDSKFITIKKEGEK